MGQASVTFQKQEKEAVNEKDPGPILRGRAAADRAGLAGLPSGERSQGVSPDASPEGPRISTSGPASLPPEPASNSTCPKQVPDLSRHLLFPAILSVTPTQLFRTKKRSHLQLHPSVVSQPAPPRGVPLDCHATLSSVTPPFPCHLGPAAASQLAACALSCPRIESPD